MDDLIDRVTGSSGLIEIQTNTLENEQRDLEAQIERQERFLESRREAMEADFIRMEEAQAEINQQMDALIRAFP